MIQYSLLHTRIADISSTFFHNLLNEFIWVGGETRGERGGGGGVGEVDRFWKRGLKILFSGRPLDKYLKILEIGYPAAEKVFSNRSYSVKAFEMTGLYPFNPNAIKPDQSAPATIYADPKPSTVTSGALAALESASGSSVGFSDTAPPPAKKIRVEDEILPQSDDESSLALFSNAADPIITGSVSATVSSAGTASSSSSTVPSASESSLPTLSTVPKLTLAERRKDLLKFEVNHLNDEQLAEFEDFFSRGIYKARQALYMSWLFLKLDAVGTEQEVFDSILGSTVPKGLKKSKTKRKNPLSGPDRSDPQSGPFMALLQTQEDRDNGVPKLTARGRGRGRGGRGGGRGGRGRGDGEAGAAT